MDIKVSLIIPVYNVEKYLRKCLNCAINQTLKDIEIIVVNDGSTDLSPEIINEFKNKHKNFIVVNQENMGLSAARNIGIKIAKGEYIAFADSDDYFDENFLYFMYAAVKKSNSDIAVCGFYTVKENKQKFKHKKQKHHKYKVISSKIALKQLFKDIKIHNYAWNKIYRRELFISNDIFYPVAQTYEDLATTYRLFFKSKKIVILKDKLYYYLQRKDSITKKFKEKNAQDILKSLYNIKIFLNENDAFKVYKNEFIFLCLKNMAYINIMSKKHNLDNKKIKKINKLFRFLLKKSL